MAKVREWLKKNAFGLRWAAAIITITALTKFVVAIYIIPSRSMTPTIFENDVALGTRINSSYERGDIIAFHPPVEGREHEQWIKRIIAVGGETIVIKGDEVFIDGELFDEPYKLEPMVEANDYQFTVPEGCYFVMGDNRNGSNDARDWENHFVSEDRIVAKLRFGIYPIREY